MTDMTDVMTDMDQYLITQTLIALDLNPKPLNPNSKKGGQIGANCTFMCKQFWDGQC